MYPDLLPQLAAEFRTFVPRVVDCLKAYWLDPSRGEDLHEAYRKLHTLVGDSAVVGELHLSRAVLFAEETVESVLEDGQAFNERMGEFLTAALAEIENYSRRLEIEGRDAEGLLVSVALLHRRFLDLPEAEDEDAILELLGMSPEEPAPPTATESETVPETYYPELLDMFIEESVEKLQILRRAIPEYAGDPHDRNSLGEIRRVVHSLKGEAFVVGLRDLGEFAHRLEDLLDALFENLISYSAPIESVLGNALDVIDDFCAPGRADSHFPARVAELTERIASLTPDEATTPETIPAEAPVVAVEAVEMGTVETRPARKESDELYVRVPLSRLDALARLLGELVINHSAFQENLSGVRREVDELRIGSGRLDRMTGRLETEYEVAALGAGRLATSVAAFATPAFIPPKNEFDDLELDRYGEFHLLTRQISETNSDISTSGHRMGMLAGDYDTLVNRLGRLANEAQEKVMNLRMIPFRTLGGKLRQIVRVAASKTGKSATVEIQGEDVELDKALLEALSEPASHLLRNAVDHGIETPEIRRGLGKTVEGRLSVRVRQEGSDIVIDISDDGAGIDLEKLRRKAVTDGIRTDAEAFDMTETELIELMFQPGFSTADAISEISGRGVGLDVVRETVRRLKGTLTVEHATGAGTMFRMRVPVRLAVTKAFLVRCGGETFAIPFAEVSRVLQVAPDALKTIGTTRCLHVGNVLHEALDLARALDLPTRSDSTPAGLLPFLLIDSGGKRIALQVDELLEQRDIVVKPLGSHIRKLPGFSGATLLGDGRVVLILDPRELTEAEPDRRPTTAPRVTPNTEPLRVLVVDDSLSTRTVVGNVVRNHGWTPVFARDGIEALELIQSERRLPDVVVSDIEMPRMDGFELTSTLRANAAYRDLPVVMLTSRTGEKHRRHALGVGVTAYLVKPFDESQLAGAIRNAGVKGRTR